MVVQQLSVTAAVFTPAADTALLCGSTSAVVKRSARMKSLAAAVESICMQQCGCGKMSWLPLASVLQAASIDFFFVLL
jgi:hypothetical protein